MLYWNSGGSYPPKDLALRDERPRTGQRTAIASVALRRRGQPDLARHLVDSNLVTIGQMLAARAQMRQDHADLADVLLAEGWLGADALLQARADCFGLSPIDLTDDACDPALTALLDPATCLRLRILPLGRAADGTFLIATSHPESFPTLCPDLPAPLHLAHPVLVSPSTLQDAIARHWRAPMTNAALTRVPKAESCRGWAIGAGRRTLWLGLLVVACLGAVLLAPVAVFAILALWAGGTLVVAALHKSLAVAAFLTRRNTYLPQPPPQVAQPTVPHHAALPTDSPPRPVVSILVPLYREPEVADLLIRRLERLHYPKALLDVLLVLEEGDSLTRNALSQTALPPWTRVILVPDGQPRTKPRAMNYALDFCRGQIVGIYDAEDAPDPDQIDRVVERFSTAPPDLVCLQGVLDYYNPRQNWMARCFTIEYASWFRVMMPGMARLGFAIPLGGTTLFFRRAALETLGGWDAHNVTEDADLGFRLARHGMRTEMITTTTSEEACCHPLPWVRQRSRWLKGYMVTYLVHMRRPRLLLRQLGLWRFIGYQTHFITALSQFLLAPVLWSFWLVLLGLPHPLDGVLSAPLLTGIARTFLLVELLTLATGLLAVSGPAHRHLMFWVPTLQFYFPLGVLAAYKALYELVRAPFYWDKTTHGHSLIQRGPGLVTRLLSRRS
jgi:glycosyltransferase XagB